MRSHLGTALLISFALMLLTCTPATKQPEPEAEATNEANDMAALDDLRGDSRRITAATPLLRPSSQRTGW